MSELLEHPERARIEALASAFRPRVPQLDHTHTFDRDAFARLGDAGLYEPDQPLSAQVAGVLGAVLGARDLGLGASICAHLCAVDTLHDLGGPGDVLDALRSGRWCGSVANSEPGAGTDLLSMKTRAIDHRLTGDKGYITNVGQAEAHIVSARTQAGEIHGFVVLESDPGVMSARVEDLVGLRTSATGRLTLSGAHGAPLGEGLGMFRRQFDRERLLTGALYVGAMTMALERARAHLEARPALAKHQYVQDKIVGAKVARDLSASHVWMMARAIERGDPVRGELSALKLHGLEAAQVATRSIQSLLGGQGLRCDEPLEKLGRDLRALTMLGGSVELHKMVTFRAWRQR